MSVGPGFRNAVSLVALAAALVSCGGGGSGSAGGSGVIVPPSVPAPPTPPPPPPTPTPTPPPPTSITPVAGQIFANPSLTPTLFAVARGWQFDYTGGQGPLTNSQLSEEAGATYMAGSSSYQLTIPLLGTNTLYQTFTATDRPEIGGTAYIGTTAASPAAAQSGTDLLVLRPGSGTPYTYASLVSWYTVQELGGGLFRNSYGVLGLAQPTAAAGIPASGARRYSGTVLAHIERDAGSFVIGTIMIDADFTAGTLSGSLTLQHVCFMGCSYPTVSYPLSNFVYTRGGTEFSGVTTAGGAPGQGSFSGRFAGPAAEEMVVSFRAPYRDPDRNIQVSISGVALARQP